MALPSASRGTHLGAARQDRWRQTVSPASPGTGRSRVTPSAGALRARGDPAPRRSPKLAGASSATAPPPTCRSRENPSPGQLHSTPLGRGGHLPHYLPPPCPHWSGLGARREGRRRGNLPGSPPLGRRGVPWGPGTTRSGRDQTRESGVPSPEAGRGGATLCPRPGGGAEVGACGA